MRFLLVWGMFRKIDQVKSKNRKGQDPAAGNVSRETLTRIKRAIKNQAEAWLEMFHVKLHSFSNVRSTTSMSLSTL